MKVTLKLFASLGEFLPDGAARNQVELEVPDGTTAMALIDRFNVPRRLAHLVLIDGVFIPPAERETRELRERNQLAVFPPVAGG